MNCRDLPFSTNRLCNCNYINYLAAIILQKHKYIRSQQMSGTPHHRLLKNVDSHFRTGVGKRNKNIKENIKKKSWDHLDCPRGGRKPPPPPYKAGVSLVLKTHSSHAKNSSDHQTTEYPSNGCELILPNMVVTVGVWGSEMCCCITW